MTRAATLKKSSTPRKTVRGSGIVALLTDFGTRDPYVGTMKGVILSVHPKAQIVDLSHEVSPQDLLNAYFLLEHTYSYFPVGTVFVAVVDPGVGTARRILCVEGTRHLFLAPDNGIVSFLFRHEDVRRIVEVTNDAFFRKPVSQTFHGRDIFAPVAGHLSSGLDPSKLGRETKEMARLAAPDADRRAGKAPGRVVTIDRFGNLITDIPGERLVGARTVRVGDAGRARIVRAYAEGKKDELIALVGSHGTVEIAVRDGSAALATGATAGTPVRVNGP